MPRSTGAAGRRSAKPTPSKRTRPARARRARARPAGRRSRASVSNTSKMRSAAVAASSAMARISPRDSTGHTSMSVSEKNATSPPSVSDPVADRERAAEQDGGQREVGDEAEQPTRSGPAGAPAPSTSSWTDARAGRELVEHELAAAERLDDADAAGALLDQRGEVALLVLHPARHRAVAALEASPTARRSGRPTAATTRPSATCMRSSRHDARRRRWRC